MKTWLSMLDDFHAERELMFGDPEGRTPKRIEELFLKAYGNAELARDMRIQADIERLTRAT